MGATDLMSRPVLTVRPDDSNELAAALITGRCITAAPVVDSAGDLIGMVSESDLLLRRVLPERSAPYRPPSMTKRGNGPVVVADVMTEDVVALPPDADLADAAEAIPFHDVRSIPILDDMAELVGIVRRRDILRTMLRTADNVQIEVQRRLDECAAGERRWTATVANDVASITGYCENEVAEKVVRALARTAPRYPPVEFAGCPRRRPDYGSSERQPQETLRGEARLAAPFGAGCSEPPV